MSRSGEGAVTGDLSRYELAHWAVLVELFYP